MKVSTKGRYALRMMLDLALHNTGEYIALKDISARQEVSVKYLEQIFKQLKKAQLLISIRGKDGGYQIAKNPNDITAKDIILAVEEKLDPVVCLSHTCMRAGICRTQSVWMGMQDEIYKVLEGKTLRYLTDIYKNEVSA